MWFILFYHPNLAGYILNAFGIFTVTLETGKQGGMTRLVA